MQYFRIVSVGLLLLVLFFLGFQLGVRYEWNLISAERASLEEMYALAGSGRTVQSDPEQEVNIDLLWGVWRLLNQQYIEPKGLSIDAMVYGAVAGMVDAVGDPYTLFMTPEDTESFENAMSGTLEGIGAQMDQLNGEVIVVAPLKGSPAEQAGLLPRDVIVTVDGADISGLRLDQVVEKIRGPAGTSVTLEIYRKDATDLVKLTIKRKNIQIPSVEFETKTVGGKNVALLTINQFGATTMEEIAALTKKFNPSQVDGLVLDLRYNGGGYLEGAVSLASMFLYEGKVVTVERRSAPPEVLEVSGSPSWPTLPMAVLINGGSASAAEIVAGALKDHKRATIVGTTSFGKGTVQEIMDLPNGAALRVTVAKWLTPSGHDLGHMGIEPDIEVDRTIEQYRAGEDPQLEAAVKALQPR
ncbi:MAG: S41 family peptidase [Candidatus Peribacteraceae bacterium]